MNAKRNFHPSIAAACLLLGIPVQVPFRVSAALALRHWVCGEKRDGIVAPCLRSTSHLPVPNYDRPRLRLGGMGKRTSIWWPRGDALEG